MHKVAAIAFLIITIVSPPSAMAQGRPNPAALIAAQREAMAAFAHMDGVWRGHDFL